MSGPTGLCCCCDVVSAVSSTSLVSDESLVARRFAVLSELSEDITRVTPKAVFRPLVDHFKFWLGLYLDYLSKHLSMIISKRFLNTCIKQKCCREISLPSDKQQHLVSEPNVRFRTPQRGRSEM
jgi:hypothetical protein